MRLLTILFALVLFISSQVTAQDKTILAKSEYMAAEEAYGNGNFEKCLQHLAKSKEHFGGSNYLMQYLEVKALYGSHQFAAASKAIKEFFEVVPKESNNTPEYLEMVKLVAIVRDKEEEENRLLQKRKTMQENEARERDILAETKKMELTNLDIETVKRDLLGKNTRSKNESKWWNFDDYSEFIDERIMSRKVIDDYRCELEVDFLLRNSRGRKWYLKAKILYDNRNTRMIKNIEQLLYYDTEKSRTRL